MEDTSESEKKKPAGGDGSGDRKSKRKMKTASQLELLEKTYAVENYPSEALRAELSVKLKLTDRQLQMWFCHRRLKDRKVAAPMAKKPRKEIASPEEVMDTNDHGSSSGIMHDEHAFDANPFVHLDSRKGIARGMHRIGFEPPMMKRYFEPQSAAEIRAIAFVESQLGEPLRMDGPILGIEFDPLPPDAFGAPIAITGQPKQAGRPYDSKIYERAESKSIKASSFLPNMDHSFVPGSSSGKRKATVGNVHMVLPPAGARALHEYQFLPEQPSVRSETYERPKTSNYYESSVETTGARVSPLPSGEPLLHGNDQVGTGYGFHGQVPNVNLLSPSVRHGHGYPPGSTEYESVPHKKSLANFGVDGQFGPHGALGLENPFVSPDKRVCQEEDAARMEKKRKNEEARIAKEVEAHEKRIRKELEKQDILRRKREEQIRREMERQDRERRKEEERLMREKQREEERFQREQKRENERRERFLQKETLRAEKMRQKEELRKEKEAARLKAATERATARRIARESMELIEDERLELMELAASSKELPSIISLDTETLLNLDLFRDMLSKFPPKSVQMKRPFAIQPWIDSEENIGNLLMVWRFLITFADVLELWPFTLDEFIQSFHDYDPRLFGEIHVALLRTIIKDIEDVARTPSIGLGANQNSAANPGGGHPQIVEGAYAWGFDIRSWQRHLNPLTWPEILRQFALSAGFGPQLKKRSADQPCFRDDNEGQDCENVVSTLRNGAAAENAVAMMQEKGFSHLRRSRHRLTPGTVKYAAFHVLSLEGSRGLTILEVADKIQKSGLRDLTTSKTPEASIAAALSRDTILFERTAPSTYCVRPAFRKDPADADAVLSAAREKMRIFESRFSDSEEAEKDAEDVDDVERDEDFECDVAEDPEIDDLSIIEASNKDIFGRIKGEVTQSSACLGNEKFETLCSDVGEIQQVALNSVEKSSSPLEGSKVVNGQSADVSADHRKESDGNDEDTEIDESDSGEPWVQGLMEGEYSDLSVEERLNALASLIGVAIEGNLIRVILEERLEAATALKKQMWAEAQLDKRRMKEDMSKFQISPFVGIKTEGDLTSAGVEGGHSPLLGTDNKGGEASPIPAVKQEMFLDSNNVQNYLNNIPTERNLSGQEFPMGLEINPFQQHAYAAEKSRSQMKAYIGYKAEELYVYRSLPLGQDRRRNRYWQFVTSASRNDPGSSRIFFESKDGCWMLIDTEEAFDALLAALDTRGVRESHLHSMLLKIEQYFKDSIKRKSTCANSIDPTRVAVKTESTEISSGSDCNIDGESPRSSVCGFNSDFSDLSTSFRIDLGKNDAEKADSLKRYLDFQKWLWTECFNPSTLCAMKYGKKRCSELLCTCDFCYDTYLARDKHCSFCHVTFENCHNLDVKFSEHVARCEEKRRLDPNCKFQGSDSFLPVRIRLLKAELALIEVSIPPEALRPSWTEVYRKSWGVKLHSSSSAEDLFQMLTLLEEAVKRDCLPSNFETTKELLGLNATEDPSSSLPGSVTVLPWVPHTTAAVALRLMEFDASVSYMLHQKESQRDKEAGDFIKVPSRFAVVKNIQDIESAELPDQLEDQQEENYADTGNVRSYTRGGRGGRGRGGRGRGRGGRWGRGSGSSSKSEYVKVKPASNERPGRGRKGRGARGRGRGRGNRSARIRQRLENAVVEKEMEIGGFEDVGIGKQNSSSGGESSRSSGDWDVEETRGRMYEEGVENNSAEMSESDDNSQGTEDESDDNRLDYGDGYNRNEELMEEESESEEDDDGDIGDGDEEDDDGDIGDGDEEGDLDGDGDEEDEDGEGDENGNGDEGTPSLSSDYSERDF